MTCPGSSQTWYNNIFAECSNDDTARLVQDLYNNKAPPFFTGNTLLLDRQWRSLTILKGEDGKRFLFGIQLGPEVCGVLFL